MEAGVILEVGARRSRGGLRGCTGCPGWWWWWKEYGSRTDSGTKAWRIRRLQADEEGVWGEVHPPSHGVGRQGVLTHGML